MNLKIAILGRPNVGKSTLFNRLAGKHLAIVDDTPGVTRDRRQGTGRISDIEFEIIDTAGLEDANDNSLEARMRKQTDYAVAEADIVLFLIDSRAGITPLDKFFSKWIRAQDIAVILVANKCEGKAGEPGLYESYGLGLGDPIPFSAEHGEGLADLYQAILPYTEDRKELISYNPQKTHSLDSEKINDEFVGMIQVAIVGRPNVGKSTLVNRIVGKERVLTGPEAGITRDSVAIEWKQNNKIIKLIDTAGLRRKSKVKNKVDSLSTTDSLRVIQYAQIVVLVLDGTLLLEKQDLTIARQVIEEGRALLIAVNKWDIVKDHKQAFQDLNDRLETSLPQVRGIPVITLSALTGKSIDQLIPAAFDLFEVWNKRIPTSKLNQWLMHITERHPPPMSSGRRIRIRYMTQAKTRPPTFVVFSSKGTDLPEAYRRFLANGIRQDFSLPGVPIRILVRKGNNPYVDS
jgi:GTP-binding protein